MEHVLWCIGHELAIPDIIRGEGCYVYDSQGRRYVDMEAGVWCLPLGHCHPGVNQALRMQLDSIIHTGYCYAHSIVEEASKEILDTLGLSDGKCVFLSSGSEVVEFGVQVLRTITGKPLLLSLSDSFLGSYGSAGRKRADEWHLFNWSVCSACPYSADCDPHCRHLADIPFAEIGGFVFEPGSSSGLVRFPPAALVQNLVRSIREHEGFVQVNEITTGIGRTGEWFGFQHYGITPDVVSMGKGLGNGYPVSAIAMSPAVADSLRKIRFHYSQSHQNDALGCAAARAVIATLRAENLIEQCRRSGTYLLDGLLQLRQKHSLMHEVRGRGLMIAVELGELVANDLAGEIYRQCLQQGFIIARRPGLNVFRIDPPLTIGRKDTDDFLESFDRILGGLG